MKTLLLLSLFFVGCSCPEGHQNNSTESLQVGGGRTIEANTVVYDSCEYVVTRYELTASITHKGNCKYCEQRKNK